MVSDLKTFAHKGGKIAEKVFFYIFFYLSTLFKHLFAAHFLKSKLFRFFGSLGKSNKKKWSQNWKLFLIKGVKLPRKKKMYFFLANFALLAGFFLVLVLLSASVKRFFVSCMQDFFFDGKNSYCLCPQNGLILCG